MIDNEWDEDRRRENRAPSAASISRVACSEATIRGDSAERPHNVKVSHVLSSNAVGRVL